MVLSACYSWAKETFGHACLGDLRRTRRLVTLAASLAQHAGLSIVKSSRSAADVEGAYRLMRNPRVTPEAIADAGFSAAAKAAQAYPLLLALEDTTSVNFSHASAYDELGNTTTHQKTRGLLAHSVLLYAPDSARMVGLIDQQRWSRNTDSYGKSHERKQRPYAEKESARWQQSSQLMAQRLGDMQSRVISVCDREADIWHYLDYKISQGQRFVVRAAQDRLLADRAGRLFDLPDALTLAGSHTLNVVQKGGRAARQAQMFVSYSEVLLRAPGRQEGVVPVTYICCREEAEGGACWHLLTSEKVESMEQARVIISYYERRWIIEEYHKAWKSGGTQVESVRMQSRDNLERMVVILAFIAVRVLALRQGGLSEETLNRSCEEVLSRLEWKLLWVKQEGKALPEKAPNLKWAYLALAKMGRWYDSKRTGRAGWIVMWEGWFKLQDIVEGYHLAKSLDQEI